MKETSIGGQADVSPDGELVREEFRIITKRILNATWYWVYPPDLATETKQVLENIKLPRMHYKLCQDYIPCYDRLGNTLYSLFCQFSRSKVCAPPL